MVMACTCARAHTHTTHTHMHKLSLSFTYIILALSLLLLWILHCQSMKYDPSRSVAIAVKWIRYHKTKGVSCFTFILVEASKSVLMHGSITFYDLHEVALFCCHQCVFISFPLSSMVNNIIFTELSTPHVLVLLIRLLKGYGVHMCARAYTHNTHAHAQTLSLSLFHIY